MKYVQTHGLNLSAFMLGTVQLGMEYGLGEDKAKPSQEKAFQILDRAMELGVNTLDTADNYGDSEAVIGRWMEHRRQAGLETPWVVTKVSTLDHSSYDALRDCVFRKTEGCMKNLGVDKIDCMMIHAFEDYANDRDNMHKIFDDMKSQGMYEYSAISAYSRHDYGVLAESGFDAVQIPLNVFDWSQIENGGMEKLKNAGMMVYTRSVFLQGLVFQKPEKLDPRMDFCVQPLTRYLELCKEFQLSPAVLALSFALSVPGVTNTVLGCDNVQQLEANCELFNQTVKLTQEQWNLLRDAFVNIDPRVINPGVWYNHT